MNACCKSLHASPKISREQSRARPVVKYVSMKRIRFRKNPQVFEIKASGRQVPVRHRPREYMTVYRTSEEVPVSSKIEQHEAQVRARQLQETVTLHDTDAKPSCEFLLLE